MMRSSGQARPATEWPVSRHASRFPRPSCLSCFQTHGAPAGGGLPPLTGTDAHELV